MARAHAAALQLPDLKERAAVLADLATDDRPHLAQSVHFPELKLAPSSMPLPAEVKRSGVGARGGCLRFPFPSSPFSFFPFSACLLGIARARACAVYVLYAAQVTTFEAAREVFKLGLGRHADAKRFYVLDGYVTDHVALCRDVRRDRRHIDRGRKRQGRYGFPFY